ncbi:MAG TPA: alpha/beta hydrolase [Candidatus Baltobacteraceae bacterium]|nr:alpha/beta hydrolase [Candidatus Baltobacteraceae bacterium]
MRLVLTIVVAYVVALFVIRIFESHFIFFPNDPGRLEGDWKPRDLQIQNVWLKASDGVKLHAWWIGADDAVFTFLAFHGNAGNIADRADIYRFLHRLPANILAVEYRGYGRSEGTPTEAGLYRDAEAGYAYLTNEKAIDPRTIVSYGQSLGTAVAAHLAANRPVGAVVLEAPFPSARVLAAKLFWFLPGVNVLVWRQFDTERGLASIEAPLLVVHCTQDPVIPPEMGERVFASASEPKSIFRVNGYCHEEASIISPEKYQVQLRDFLKQVDSRHESRQH